jgi:photosystem II stability/assembly factor-like uncharacterized protein
MNLSKIFFVFIFFINFLFAQWVQTSGPEGGDIQCIAKCNDDIFCGTLGGGLFKSTDDGLSWKSANIGLPSDYIYCLAVSGSNLFASIYGGVFLSSDNGVSWQEANNGLNNHVTELAVRGSKLVAATEAGVYFSTNNGTSWNLLNGSPWYVSALALTDTSIYAGSTYTGLYYYNYNDTTWHSIGLNDLDVWGVAVIDNVILAATLISGMMRSTDNGASWTQVEGEGWNFIVLDSIVYSAGWGVYKSTDKGLTWTSLSPEDLMLSVLAVDTPNLYAGDSEGVFRSTDDGNSWTKASTGLINTDCYSLSSIYSNVFTLAGNSGGMISSDYGETWNIAGQGLTDLGQKNINSFLQKDDYIFAATNYGIYLSADSGISWTGCGFTDEAIQSIVSLDSFIFAAGFISGVFRSSDNGSTWYPVHPGTESTSLAVCGNYIFLNRIYGGLFRSSNYGLNWTQLGGPGTGSLFLGALSDKIFYPVNDGNVYVSSDFGNSWNICSGFSSGTLVIKSLTPSDTTMFALTNTGLYQCTYSSTVFMPVDPDFNYEINSITIHDSYIFAAVNWRGIWKMQLPGLSSVKDSDIPTYCFLEQNYPNPFNPNTVIEYTIPYPSHVTITVYDLLGRETAKLVDEEKAAGKYKTEFNASNLTSGMYLYQIKSGSYIRTKKMMVIK